MAIIPAGYPPTRLNNIAGPQHPGKPNKRVVIQRVKWPGVLHSGESASRPDNSMKGYNVGMMTVVHIAIPRLMPVDAALGYFSRMPMAIIRHIPVVICMIRCLVMVRTNTASPPLWLVYDGVVAGMNACICAYIGVR